MAARDDRGKTALAIAIEQSQDEVAGLLRAAGARE
jgi:ankyrin repeat protein